jgi:putative methyltransferase (TIGR04325 family)
VIEIDNKMDVRTLIKDWIPPAVWRGLRRFRGRQTLFLGEFPSWEAAAENCSGYADERILATVLEATMKVSQGEATYERDSVLFDEIVYSWPVLAALMWTAARAGGRLSVLDFGGSLGTTYFQNKRFLHGLASVIWSVVEQPHYVEAGRTHIQDRHLRFYNSPAECVARQQPNVVLMSGVLQCIAEPRSVLDDLLRLECDTVILDRTAYVAHGSQERIRIQRVPKYIYDASYPCRFLVEDVIVDHVSAAGYALVERFDALDRLDPSAVWRGHIFSKRRF